MAEHPQALKDIIDLCAGLAETERREMLISFADGAARQAPQPGESFDLEDTRKDEECTDTVGVFLRIDDARLCHFRITLGPQVQTLTRAMTTILCQGFNGASPETDLDAPADAVVYLDARDQPVNMALVTPASTPAIEDVLYEFLPAGFEINDGSQGTLTIDVAAGTVTLEHGENYTETRDSTQEFTL